MEEKLDLLIKEIKGLKDEVKGLSIRMDSFEERMDVFEKRLDLQGKQIAENFATLDKKIDDTRLELKREIINQTNEIKKEIRDFKEVNGRQHLKMSENFEYLYQESKNDIEELHQSVNDLSKAHKLNRMDIDKLIAKC